MTSNASSVTPFEISVSDKAIEDLHSKLASATLPDEIEAAGWDYGSPLADVKRLAKYWNERFDWKKAEQNLNSSLAGAQYRTPLQVDGFEELQIHFLWRKSENKNAIPLLFVHGWPGSFFEATKIFNELGHDAGDGPAFDVVVPSLPNYGFSEGSKKRGFGIAEYAATCHQLMQKLGYNKYVTQGGDWGFFITRAIGILYPQYCKASHVNMPFGMEPSFMSNPFLALKHAVTPYTDEEKKGLARTQWFNQEGSGYRKEQSTKPQTLGYALADSPVALLAWIYEKLHDWTDGYSWTDDEICTWVSIYWFSTAGPAANIRIYYESEHPQTQADADVITRDRLQKWVPHVPLGLAYFPKELRVIPKTWGRTMGPVVFESEYEKGGHFAAWERPDAILKDLRSMFGKDGGAYGVVPGRNGYERATKL